MSKSTPDALAERVTELKKSIEAKKDSLTLPKARQLRKALKRTQRKQRTIQTATVRAAGARDKKKKAAAAEG